MPAKLSIEYTEKELTELILADLAEKMPGFHVVIVPTPKGGGL